MGVLEFASVQAGGLHATLKGFELEGLFLFSRMPSKDIH